MARPREFDFEHAVDGAMQIFWRQGYHATNLPDLLNAMGLTRGSFYKAFGDKRRACLEALNRYNKVNISAAVGFLEGPSETGGLSRIRELFASVFSEQADKRMGCFVCNAMIELAPVDEDVAKLAAAMTGRVQGAFLKALTEDGPGDPDGTLQRAIALTNMYFGAQAISKTGQELPDWRELLGNLLDQGKKGPQD